MSFAYTVVIVNVSQMIYFIFPVSTIDLALNIIPEFSLSEIQIATSDFDPSHVIGRGGFGIVYRGKLERLKLDVAIKKLNEVRCSLLCEVVHMIGKHNYQIWLAVRLKGGLE